jgi:osmoprotectant transport system ATP-binding protein
MEPPPGPPPELEAVSVAKAYSGRIRALDGVSLTVRTGETLVLIGESGCGKTTLLRMFNRMVEPTGGEIRIRGVRASDLDPIRLRRNTGYVQQEGGLLPHWTIARNVALVPRLLGWDAARTAERVRELLELVGLSPGRFGDRHPHALSGGQRQRVAFARSLAADPEVVLLDEPFGALDAITRVDLQTEFLAIKRRLGKTMLLVTHDLDEAFRLGDRVAVLRRGRILQCAPPRELSRNPASEYVADLVAHARSRP